jgi:hypothetical protein
LQQSGEPKAVRRNITMGPRGGIPVRVRARAAARGRRAA